VAAVPGQLPLLGAMCLSPQPFTDFHSTARICNLAAIVAGETAPGGLRDASDMGHADPGGAASRAIA
jgi:hypothetical protein